MLSKVLLIEDFQTKADSIISHLTDEFPNVRIERRESYKSALSEICNNAREYDLILLDMSMSTFDVTAEESGGEPEPLAGQLILENMYLRDISTKVIVVTMFEKFDDIKLNQLDERLSSNYPEIYLGNIFFSFKISEWKNNLTNLIRAKVL